MQITCKNKSLSKEICEKIILVVTKLLTQRSSLELINPWPAGHFWPAASKAIARIKENYCVLFGSPTDNLNSSVNYSLKLLFFLQ